MDSSPTSSPSGGPGDVGDPITSVEGSDMGDSGVRSTLDQLAALMAQAEELASWASASTPASVLAEGTHVERREPERLLSPDAEVAAQPEPEPTPEVVSEMTPEPERVVVSEMTPEPELQAATELPPESADPDTGPVESADPDTGPVESADPEADPVGSTLAAMIADSRIAAAVVVGEGSSEVAGTLTTMTESSLAELGLLAPLGAILEVTTVNGEYRALRAGSWALALEVGPGATAEVDALLDELLAASGDGASGDHP